MPVENKPTYTSLWRRIFRVPDATARPVTVAVSTPEPTPPPEDDRRPAKGQLAHPLLNPERVKEWIGAEPFKDRVLDTQFRAKQGAAYQTPLGPYKEILDKDATVQAALAQRHADIFERERLLHEGADNPKAKRARDLAEKCIESFNTTGDGGFHKDLRDMLMAVPYGIAIMEVIWDDRTYKLDGAGKTDWYVPVSLEARDPEAFAFDPATGDLLIYQGNKNEYAVAPPRKFIVYRPFAEYENNWGVATLRPLAWLCWFSRVILTFWVKTAERWGDPKVFISPEEHLTSDKEDTLVAILDNIQNETGVLLPERTKPYFLQIANGEPTIFERFLSYKDEQVRLVLLGQTLTSAVSSTGGGSAVGEVHERRQAAITAMDARSLESCFNSTLLRWITDINFGVGVESPELEIVTDPPKNIKDIVDYTKVLCEIGYRPSRQGLLDATGVPIAVDEEDELTLMPAAYAGATGQPMNDAQRTNQQNKQPSQQSGAKTNQKAKERANAKPAANQPRPRPQQRSVRP